jgi:hypothetical protein
MSGYPYCSENPLEEPNNYSYSNFSGITFLICWRSQRLKSLTISPISVAERVVGGSTDQLIARLIILLKRNEVDEELWLSINMLLKRFEVTKKLHKEYDENWRPKNSLDYTSPERYLSFCEMMDLAFLRREKYQYLNALLKCMDVTTALSYKFDVEQNNRLKNLVHREFIYISNLSDKLAINFRGNLK